MLFLCFGKYDSVVEIAQYTLLFHSCRAHMHGSLRRFLVVLKALWPIWNASEPVRPVLGNSTGFFVAEF